jgi:AmiR/NasT family two-component response regulator
MELPEACEQTHAQTASQAWRYVVAQATGILMARFRINSEAAQTRLADLAAEDSRPVVAVAREIVEEVNRSGAAWTRSTGRPPHLR